MIEITAEIVRELLAYDAETGVFRWLQRDVKWFSPSRMRTAESECVRWNKSFSGSVAGSINGRGYFQIGLFGRRYYVHRIAWLYVTGSWPEADIDHLNGNKTDNRFSNLRSVCDLQNCKNRGLRSDNKSGFTGVYPSSTPGKWKAQIRTCGKVKHLGTFLTPQDAHAAYVLAAEGNGYTDRHIYGG